MRLVRVRWGKPRGGSGGGSGGEGVFFGVSGVRVVDASAFPILVPGHPQSAIYALTEKIADLIINNGTASV